MQDGKLYGVGNGGGVYTIDPSTAAAVFVNSLTVPLAGTFFGVDFNPAADRLRIISDTGQNLAHNVIAAGVTAANATLTYTPPPASPVAALGLTAAAYTNNDLNQPTQGRRCSTLIRHWTRSSFNRLQATACSSPRAHSVSMPARRRDSTSTAGSTMVSLLPTLR